MMEPFGGGSGNGSGKAPRDLNKRFFGKYRAQVVSNVDLDPATATLHRIEVSVPDVFPAGQTVWATPCLPYSGEGVGFYTKPPVGASVWVEFEGGNANSPIWAGCFWDEAELLEPFELNPLDPAQVKLIKTASTLFVLNDTEALGGVTLQVTDPAVEIPVVMQFSSLGVSISTGICSLKMVPEEGITLSVGEVVISMTEEGINMTGPAITAEAEGDISLDAGGAIEAEAGGDVTIDAGGAVEFDAGGDVEIAAGGGAELNAGGDVEIAGGGACELNAGGDVEIAAGGAIEINSGLDIEVASGLAVEINAGLDVEIAAAAAMELSAIGDIALTAVTMMQTGLVEVNGDLLIDGQQPLVI